MAELVAQSLSHPLRVGARPVALVDEGDPRHLVALHLAVDRDRLRLHPGHRAQHQHRAVQHPQRALDLDREVDVARGVDDVDVVALPLHIGRGRGDGDAALPLQLHVVHGRADAVLALDVVDRIDLLRVEEDPFRQRGLAGVDVGGDADISDPLDVRNHVVLACGPGRSSFHHPPVPAPRRMSLRDSVGMGEDCKSTEDRAHPHPAVSRRCR